MPRASRRGGCSVPSWPRASVVSLLVAAIAVYVSPWSLRELRDWATQVRADILTNIVQPGRFTTIGGNLTFHIADRRPNGLLEGIFLDDRRDPNEHSTYLAERGEIVKNDSGSFLVLEKGSVQRIEGGQRDPRIVTFDRYPFDLSKFTTGPQSVTYNTREKYLWELIWPAPNDRLLIAQAGEFRSEMHDRFATPLYPLAFVILAYAFLGPPQTTRQSRTLSLLGLIGAVSVLRLIGFLSVIVGAHNPSAIALQYVALGGSMAGGLWLISRGQAIEPAAAVSRNRNHDRRAACKSDGEVEGQRMIAGTLSRYFGWCFLKNVVGSFFGVVALAAMIDYVELLRRSSDWPKATALILAEISVFRVPQLSERIMPFAVLVGAMSCYLALSRRLELVVARAAGVSAWQFVAPSMVAAFLFGTVATTIYNPLAAVMHERSKRLESEMMGELPASTARENNGGLWVRQRSADGAAIINAKSSREQGVRLSGVSVYTFDSEGQFQLRIEAKCATLEQGYWRFDDARIYASGKPPLLRGILSARHRPDPRAGAGKFCHTGNRPILAASFLHRTGGSRRAGRGRLSAAISAAAGAAVPADRHGPARCIR